MSTGAPFHTASFGMITILFLTGSTGGGVWFCCCLRQVELHGVGLHRDGDDEQDERHSITSMSGVVLMSIIGSADSGLRTAALIDLLLRPDYRRPPRGVGSEMKPMRA